MLTWKEKKGTIGQLKGIFEELVKNKAQKTVNYVDQYNFENTENMKNMKNH